MKLSYPRAQKLLKILLEFFKKLEVLEEEKIKLYYKLKKEKK